MVGVLMVGVPVVLAHAHMIQPEQLALALPSALLLGGTAVAYDYCSRTDETVPYNPY